MAKWITRLQSVGFARQTDLNTENTTDGDFTYFRSRVVIREDGREVEDIEYATGQIGVREAPVAQGSHPGEFTVSGVIEGFKNGYDASSEQPPNNNVISPIIALICNALGSDGSSAVSSAANFRDGTHGYTRSYVSGDVASAPGNNIVGVTTGASYNEGEFYVSQTNEDGASPCVGWISDVDTTPTPDELSLFEDPQNAPVVSDDVLGCIVGYLSNNARVPFTTRVQGDNAGHKYSLLGCTPKTLKITAQPDKPPMYELTHRYIDMVEYSSGGALQTVSEFDRISPWNGSNSGALTYGAPFVSAGGAGTQGTGAATCGWEDFELTIEWPLVAEPCPSKVGAVSEFTYGDPDVKLAVKVPRDSADTVAGGENPYEKLLSDQTARSIILYCGEDPGKMFSLKLQSMKLSAAVPLEDVNGRLKYSLEWRPARYSADTGTTAPANAPVACGWA